MRVTCPKCQFENQADSSRVVCARCATIIEVRPEAGMGGYDSYNTNFEDPGYGDSGYDSRRATANYQNNNPYDSNPYASGNYTGGYAGADNSGYNNANYPTAPVGRSADADVYATRIDDDFDDVLDIPRSAPSQPQNSGYQMNEPAPVFDDVFSTPDYGMPRDPQRPGGADPYQGGVNDPYRAAGTDPYRAPGNDPYRAPGADPYRAAGTDPYRTPGNDPYAAHNMNEQGFDNPSYGVPPEPEFMGWPVLPEDSTDPGIAPSSAFDKKNTLLRTLFFVALGVGGLFILWSVLSGGFGKGTKTPVKRPEAVETARNNPEETAKPAGSENQAGGEEPAKNENQPPAGPSGAAPKAETGASKNEKSPVSIPPVSNGGKVLPPETTTVTKPPKAEPPPKAEAPAMTVPNRGNITIQIGSFNDRAQADERISRLKNAGIDARIVSANLGSRGTWYRVQVGRFPSREQATGFANQLRGRGLVQDVLVTPVN